MYRQQQIDFKPEEVIMYLRKSRSDDPALTVEEVLEKHETILDEWAERNLGARIPAANRFREVASGESLKERPEMNTVLRMIESPRYKMVAIADCQRISRGDLEDIGRIMKLFKLTNTLIATPAYIYDLRLEYDWDAFERELKRGNDYLEYYKKIQAAGKALSFNSGNYLGSTPPYGFDKITVMDGKRKCPTLKENPEQADVVRLIFDLFVNQDMGRHRIAHYLDDMGAKTMNGKHWNHTTIRDIIKNVHYIGKVRWNWRKTMQIVEDGEIRKVKTRSKIEECMIGEGRHDGIISEELFYAAQEKLARKAPRAKDAVKVRNPLASIIFCGKCGRAVVYKDPKLKDGRNKGRKRLVCSDQSNCGCGSCVYDEVIERVCEVLEQCIEDFEVRLGNDEGDSIKLHAKLIKNLENKMAALRAKELAQWETQSDPDPDKRMPHEIFKQLNAKLLEEKEAVNQALCKAYESMPEPVDYAEKVVTFRAALIAMRDPNVDAERKNKLLKACIERIEYYRDKPQRVANQWDDPPIELDIKLRV